MRIQRTHESLAPKEPTRRSARTRWREAATALSLVAFSAGCSTLPFAPESGRGAGAALTLATVDHVSKRNDELERRVSASVEERVASEVSAARELDRARMEKLEADLEERGEELATLSAALDESRAQTAELARLLTASLEGLAADADEMRRIAARLDAEVDRLPFETLRRLSLAIESHLTSEARRASATPSVRPIVSTAPTAPTTPER